MLIIHISIKRAIRIVYNMHYLWKLYMDKQTKMHVSTNSVENQNYIEYNGYDPYYSFLSYNVT